MASVSTKDGRAGVAGVKKGGRVGLEVGGSAGVEVGLCQR